MASTHSSAGPTPSENWFVTTDDDGTFELSLNELTDGIESGRVPLSALVWRAGMRGWLALNEVPLLQLLVTRLDLSRLSSAQPASPATPKGDERSDATRVHGAEAVPLPAQPMELDDGDLTVVTTPPAAVMELDDDELTVVTQSPRDPVTVSDEEWTIEPQEILNPERPILGRPIINLEPEQRPQAKAMPVTSSATGNTGSVEKHDDSDEWSKDHEKPAACATSVEPGGAHARSGPSLSDRAPPKPRSAPSTPMAAPVADTASHVSQLPSAASAVATTHKSDGPSPASLLALAGRLGQSKASGSATRAPALSPPRRVTSPLRVAQGEQSARSGVARQRSSVGPEPAVSRPKAASPPSTPRIKEDTPQRGMQSPPLVQVALPIQQPTGVQATTVATSSAPVPNESRSSPTPEPLAPQDTFGITESLAPSVSTITNAFRPSRRPFYVAAAALVAIGALALSFAGSGPSRKSRGAIATATKATPAGIENVQQPPKVEPEQRQLVPVPPVSRVNAVNSETAGVAVAENSGLPATRIPEKAVAAQKPVATTRTNPRTDWVPTQSTVSKHTDSRSTEPEAPVSKRQRVETKSADPEAPTASKGAKKADTPSSVASWDEGPVENRSWMSPGF